MLPSIVRTVCDAPIYLGVSQTEAGGVTARWRLPPQPVAGWLGAWLGGWTGSHRGRRLPCLLVASYVALSRIDARGGGWAQLGVHDGGPDLSDGALDGAIRRAEQDCEATPAAHAGRD